MIARRSFLAAVPVLAAVWPPRAQPMVEGWHSQDEADQEPQGRYICEEHETNRYGVRSVPQYCDGCCNQVLRSLAGPMRFEES